jgi:hypothetical protein
MNAGKLYAAGPADGQEHLLNFITLRYLGLLLDLSSLYSIHFNWFLSVQSHHKRSECRQAAKVIR